MAGAAAGARISTYGLSLLTLGAPSSDRCMLVGFRAGGFGPSFLLAVAFCIVAARLQGADMLHLCA